jgi:hypothetical protein
MKLRHLGLFLGALLIPILNSCATVTRGSIPLEVTAEDYSHSRAEKGVVLLAVNWGRQWGCSVYENAELMDLGFDRLPLATTADGIRPAVFLDGPPRVTKTPVYVTYALFVPEGEYALSRFKIKAAKSVSDVGYFIGERQQLVPEGEVKSGTFLVKAGETVYIGHFYLDCYADPIPWRYYLEDRAAFNEFLQSVKAAYSFLDLNNAQYRLFSTQSLGKEFQLPN